MRGPAVAAGLCLAAALVLLTGGVLTGDALVLLSGGSFLLAGVQFGLLHRRHRGRAQRGRPLAPASQPAEAPARR